MPRSLLLLLALTGCTDARPNARPSLPFARHEVIQPLGEFGFHRYFAPGHWYSALIDQDGHRFCALATADDLIFATRDYFVVQLRPRGLGQPLFRIRVWVDSTLLEDRPPQRDELRHGAIIVTGRSLQELSSADRTYLVLQLAYLNGSLVRYWNRSFLLSAYHALRHTLTHPVCPD